MFRTLKTVIARSQDTLLADAIGAASLMIILASALYLPGMI